MGRQHCSVRTTNWSTSGNAHAPRATARIQSHVQPHFRRPQGARRPPKTVMSAGAAQAEQEVEEVLVLVEAGAEAGVAG